MRVNMADAKTQKMSEKSKEVKKPGKPRNYDLGNGIYRFSRTRMYHKKAIYKFLGKKVAPKKPKTKTQQFAEKPIGGEKNGGKRVVRTVRKRAYYATQDKILPRNSRGRSFSQHKRNLRSSLQPGTILIVLAGPHKGKRVVLLKQLFSGMLLVTGPFKINGCPMRRMHPNYVIATQTRVDLGSFKLNDSIDDEYFKRERKRRPKKEEGDIFATKKAGYKPTDQRKSDQKIVDKQVIDAIKKNADKKLLFAYLATMFGLRSSQYPHRMKF
ncbi:large ribosomal subunit protein eL6 [Onthophagus taurus]|uniref:large ribosomal subunit protein eL6 n=1 Tax=Onthophagus taurus TaxID=166361 RepID=UPI000C1FEA82|nr:60S ribosomal protein L6 [Onthophagus taurus]